MRLQEYESICYNLGRACDFLSEGSFNTVEFLGAVSELAPALHLERDTQADELRADCRSLVASGTIGLRRTGALQSRIEGLRRGYLSVYGKIEALLGDISNGLGDFSVEERKALISALDALHLDTRYLSRVCLSELDKKAAKIEKDAATFPDWIKGFPTVLENFEKLVKAGKLDQDYKPVSPGDKNTVAVMAVALAGQNSGLPKGSLKRLCSYWGVDQKTVSHDANQVAFTAKYSNMVKEIDEILGS